MDDYEGVDFDTRHLFEVRCQVRWLNDRLDEVRRVAAELERILKGDTIFQLKSSELAAARHREDKAADQNRVKQPWDD